MTKSTPSSEQLSLSYGEDPYATIDDEVCLVCDLHLTRHELAELRDGVVPVRLKKFADQEARVLDDPRVYRLVTQIPDDTR